MPWQTGFTLLLFSRNGSTTVPISHSKLDLKACVQNKGVVRRLFGSILILYMSEGVITSALVLVFGEPTEFVKP